MQSQYIEKQREIIGLLSDHEAMRKKVESTEQLLFEKQSELKKQEVHVKDSNEEVRSLNIEIEELEGRLEASESALNSHRRDYGELADTGVKQINRIEELEKELKLLTILRKDTLERLDSIFQSLSSQCFNLTEYLDEELNKEGLSDSSIESYLGSIERHFDGVADKIDDIRSILEHPIQLFKSESPETLDRIFNQKNSH